MKSECVRRPNFTPKIDRDIVCFTVVEKFAN